MIHRFSSKNARNVNIENVMRHIRETSQNQKLHWFVSLFKGERCGEWKAYE